MNTTLLVGAVESVIADQQLQDTYHVRIKTKNGSVQLSHTVLLDSYSGGLGIKHIKIGSVIAVHGQVLQEKDQDECVIVASYLIAAYQSTGCVNYVEAVGSVVDSPKNYRNNNKNPGVVNLSVPVKIFSENKWQRKKTLIKVVSWNPVADILEKHVKRGDVIGINGRLAQGYSNKKMREIHAKNIHLY